MLYIILLIFLTACGSNQHASPDTGSISFKLQLSRPTTTSRAAAATSADICTDYGIATINSSVLNSSGATVASGSWSCSTHQGTVTDVPTGANYTVKLEGVDSNDTVAWTGEKTDISITGGSTTDAGTITMTYVGSDITPPTITATNPSDGAANVPVTILITATFNEVMAISSINTVTFTVKNGTTPVNGSVTYDSNTKKAIFIPPGNLSYSTTYTATITAGVEDMAGNNMQAHHSWSFTTESPPTSAPSVPTGVNATAGNGQVTITWDAVAGATSYNIYWSTTAGVIKANGTKISNVTSPYIHSGRTNGTTYYYVVTAENDNGESSESAEVSAKPGVADTTPPTGSVIINNNAAYTNSTSVTLTLTATDASGVSQMCISNENTCSSSSWETYTTSKSWILTTGDGSKTIYVWFKDGAGNANSSSYTDSITLDTTSPSNATGSNFINSGSLSTTSSTVSLTISATDNVGVVGYYASESSIAPSASTSGWVSINSQTSYSAGVSFIFSNEDGTKTIYVWFKDAAGNVSSVISDSIILHPPWTIQLGTSDIDSAYGIVTDGSGNVYVTGGTWGSLDGNPNVGLSDLFVAKFNASGVNQWTIQLGTNKYDQAYSIAIDNSGNIYITGESSGGLDGNTNLGSYDLFIVKYDSSGIKQWTRQLGTSGDEFSRGIYTDSIGNIYITGGTTGGLDGNSNAGNGGNDLFVAKYDANGTKQWTRQLGTSGDDYAYDIAIDSLDNIYVTGGTNGGLDGYTNAGDHDLFVVKFDVSGVKQWTRQLGTNNYDAAYSITVDSMDNVYVTGGTEGGLDGNTNAGSRDLFVIKYDSNGAKQWLMQLGTNDLDAANSIATDSLGNVYVTGITGGGLDGNTKAIGDWGFEDLFVVKYDSNGTKQWTRQLGTISHDVAEGITTDELGNIYITGTTEGGLDENTSFGSFDIFTVKYNSLGEKQ